MESWLLISNCQTTGLATSFQLLNRNIEIVTLDIWGYLADPEKWEAEMQNHTRVLVSPEVEGFITNGFRNVAKLSRIPALAFSGFHPDLCYVNGPAGAVQGPLGNYHSLIVFAAYKKGLAADKTMALFNGKFYESCGYLDYWEPQKAEVLKHFQSHGLDLSERFVRWGRYGAFMHSSDHPKIDVIYDVAKSFLIANNLDVQESHVRPPDSLVNGPCWPVYPEIGEALGVEGSYNFKRNLAFRHINLQAFVWESYVTYTQFEADDLSTALSYQPLFDHISGLI